MERSDFPAFAAAVAKPERRLCPDRRAGSRPTSWAARLTSRATALSDRREALTVERVELGFELVA